MSKHLFRLLFGAFFLVAATAFTGCSDDDDKSLTPKLTADPTALDFTDETATTQTVAITANCEWTVTASNLDWATISPMSGKGNGTISVTVSELPAGTNLREGKISFTLIPPPRAMLSMLTISIRSRLPKPMAARENRGLI